jgi:HEAT repeat protein/adenylate kinase family enzyme
MPIEWDLILSPIVKLAIGSTAKILAEKVKNKMLPGELKLALNKAVATAQERNDSLVAGQSIFYHCDSKQKSDFKAKVLEKSSLIEELRKPIENNGLINQAVLLELFHEVSAELKVNLVTESLPGWIKAFSDTYIDQTAAVLRFQAAKVEYVQSLGSRINKVKFVGIDVPGDEVEKRGNLEKIFVMPDVRSKERRSYREDLLRASFIEAERLASDSSSQELLKQEPVMEKLMAYQVFDPHRGSQKAVLLGVPGSGKSTLVNFFALKICQGESDKVGLNKGIDWLPIVIRIRNWISQPQQSLLEYCRYFAQDNLCTDELPLGFFEYWLERGQALVLFDGLDEVADEFQLREIAEKIESFVNKYRQNPVLITSRLVGYRPDIFDAQEFPHYVLEDFDHPKIEIFIESWYNSRIQDKIEAERCKADLRNTLKQKGQILELAKNPLLITIIALIHRYQSDLPRERYRLYEKAVSTLMTTWSKGNTPHLLLKSGILKQNDWLYIMKKVAYHIHDMGVAQNQESVTLIGKDKLIAEISRAIKRLRDCSLPDANNEAEYFVKFILVRTGLLNAQGGDRYGFVHKTFQEYLTAEEIYSQFENGDDDIIVTTIRSYLHQPHWREVLLLFVSRLKGNRAAKAIKTIVEIDSPYEQWLHRNLLFAAWCLVEAPEGLKQGDPELVANILQHILNLEIIGQEKVGRFVILELTEIFRGLRKANIQNDILHLLNKNSSVITRWRFIELKFILGQEQEAISILLDLIKDKDSFIRSNAVLELGKLGDSSEIVLIPLFHLINDSVHDVNLITIKVLHQLESFSGHVIELFLNHLKRPGHEVSYNEIIALGKLGNSTEQVATFLLHLLTLSKIAKTNFVIAEALGELGYNSKQVVTALLLLLENPNAEVRSIAVISLGKIGDIEVIPTLCHLLTDFDRWFRCRTIQSLGKLGNNSKEAVTNLLNLLEDPDDWIRFYLAEALGQLGDNSEQVTPALLHLLEDDDKGVRSNAAMALCKLGNNSKEIITALLNLLEDSDSDVRLSAVTTLIKLGEATEKVIKFLLYLLKDSSSTIRSTSAAILGELGYSSSEVITSLFQILQYSDSDTSISASTALGKLENNSEQIIIPKLTEWLTHHPDNQKKGEMIDLLKRLVDQSAGVNQAAL